MKSIVLSDNKGRDSVAPSLSLFSLSLSLVEMATVVVVFDFDRTLIDGDSDNWVVTQMGLSPVFNQFLSTMPWNSLMNKMMEELHHQGKSVDDIGDCLKKMPLHPRMISAVKTAHSMGCDLRIVSDANRFFIEMILKQHHLFHCFTEIITNPTLVDDEGRLKIMPYHDIRLSPHGCPLCPSNMCKGMILERIRASAEKYGETVFIYLGDGGGDYCPSLKLKKDDCIMPRTKFPLWQRIRDNPSLLQAEIHEWEGAEELEKILIHLINGASIGGDFSKCTSNVIHLSENKESRNMLNTDAELQHRNL